MSNQLQVFVRGTDGNLWLETANSINTQHVDGNINACQPLFPKENLLGGDISFR